MGALAAFIRCYDLTDEELAGLADNDVPLADYCAEHIQVPYLERRRPRGLAAPGSVQTLEGRPCQRDVILHPDLAILEVILTIPVDDLSTAMKGDTLDVRLRGAGTAWPKVGKDGIPGHLPQHAIDLTFRDLTGHNPMKPLRQITGFTTVALVPEHEWTPEPHAEIRSAPIPEYGPGPITLEMTYHHCIARLPEGMGPQEEALHRLCVMAARLTRSRHLEKRVLDSIDDALTDMPDMRDRHWAAIQRVSTVQEQALLFHSEMGSGRYYRNEQNKTLHAAIDSVMGIPQASVDRINAMVGGFDGLVQSYVGMGLGDAQQRFGIYGLLFAIFSVGFASIAVMDLADSTKAAYRWWVGISIVTVVSVTWAVWRSLKRRRASVAPPARGG